MDNAEQWKGGKMNEEKQAEALEKTFQEEAGKLTEVVFKYAQVYCKESGLTLEHLAFAIQLLGVNLREDFPQKLGGPARFDALCQSASDYYDQNIEKVRKAQARKEAAKR